MQKCFVGPPGKHNVGACTDGTQTCQGAEFGNWGPCKGSISPLAERCGIDMYGDRLAAEAVIGPEWDLLDPGRPARETSAPPGVPIARLERLVERLEGL